MPRPLLLGPLAALLAVSLVAVALATAPPPWFAERDADGDGLLSRQELPLRIFDRLDADGDGFLSLEEATRSSAAADPRGDDTSAGAGRTIRDVPYRTLPGVDPRRLSLDVHLPPGVAPDDRRPVLLMVHGGGWRGGDKASRGVVRPKTPWLHERGWIVVSVNHRLSPAVMHPAHVEDVAHAIAWVQREIAAHGGDPERLVLMGHSAGAHLAALAAVDAARLRAAGGRPEAISGVVLLDGAAYDVPAAMERARGRGRALYEGAFGTDPAGWAGASPALVAAARAEADDAACPPPPFLVLHVGRAAAADQARRLAAALAAAGGTATVRGFPEEDHASINRRLGTRGHGPTEATGRFLEAVLADEEPGAGD